MPRILLCPRLWACLGLLSLLVRPAAVQPAPAQPDEHLLPRAVFDLIAGEFSGEGARQYLGRIIEHHRIQGSPMMAAAARGVVLDELLRLGVPARIESLPSDGRTRYSGHLSPIGWRIRDAELWVEQAPGSNDPPLRLCRYRDVAMCVSTYSRGGSFRGELIDVGPGTAERDYAGKEVRGKVALASGYAAQVMRQAVLRRGAVGVVIYPAANDRPDHPDLIRYNGLWPTAEEVPKMSGGFQISRNQYDRLRRQMQDGPVIVRGRIDADLGPGELTLVHAYLRGSAEPEREVLLTAHLDHPKWSANDNASGSAALLELARTLHALIAARKVPPPRRTLHLMWVPEFSGTWAYVTRHPEARRCGPWDDPRQGPGGRACVVANLNLDMVGEDTVKTGSRFYITRTPDSVPSGLDALMGDVLQQTSEAGLYAPSGTRNPWPTEIIPYAQGSDHDIFLGLGIPATMLGHAPDWTHHSSADTLDKTDASELLRVGVLAGAAALFLAAADAGADAGRLQRRALGGRLALFGERLGRVAAARQEGPFAPLRAQIFQQLQADLQALAPATSGAAAMPGVLDLALAGPTGATSAASPASAASLASAASPAAPAAPRRRAVLPLSDEVFRDLGAEDQRWYEAQQRRFSAAGEARSALPSEGAQRSGAPLKDRGLVPGPGLDVVIFEAVNLLDGRRGAAQIAALLQAEFLQDIDAAWVERLLRLLSARGQVRYGQ